MASSDYEIITDPWDPKCVSACCMYFPVQEPEDTELLLEKIRGKLDERIHNHTLAEEYRIINEQIVKSQGFDVDFSKLRYLFDFQPAFLDDSDNDTGRDFFRKLSAEAIEIYNKREGTSFEFVEVEKANIYSNSGEVFFITFVAKDSWNQTKVFQAKVIHVFCREIVHSFCRLKPNQPVTCVDEESIAKKEPISKEASITRKKKRKHGLAGLLALTLLGSLNRGITDPWDPKCVRAYSMYVPGKEPEGTKRMLEKIRGKRDIRIHYHTQVEECRIINDQIVKSQGFDVDFSKLRYLFDFQPAFLDEVYPLGKPDTGRGTNFEFVEVEKANIDSNSGEVYFITFVAKDPLDKKTKVFQAKVIHVFCREIVHSFCRLKPNQPEACVPYLFVLALSRN
ncbi:hypothetical protein YC2023_122791 [Brassica napus]